MEPKVPAVTNKHFHANLYKLTDIESLLGLNEIEGDIEG
jgi:hypothetical protein